MLMDYISDYVLFDLETTGLSSETDAVIEISALKVKNGEIIEEFSTLINPEMHIPEFISDVTGITDDMVKDAPDTKTALMHFLSFIGNDVLVGHNIKGFDLLFIKRDAERFFGKIIDNECVDTLLIAQRYLLDIERHSLEALSAHYGISYEGAHRALVDCHINKQVYDCLAKEIANPSGAAKNVKICPRCGNLLKKRNGTYGEFLGCASYLDCNYTRNI